MPARRTRTAQAEPAPKRIRRASRAPVALIPTRVVASPNSDAILGDVLDRVRSVPRELRADTHLHVSDLISRCVRRRALQEEFDLPAGQQQLSLHDILTFAQGDAIHDAVKRHATMGAPHMVWGLWSCKCKYLRHTEPCTYEETDTEEVCEYCQSHVDYYNEVPIFDDEYGIVGNPDLIFWLPRKRAHHIIELKSIAHDQWKELTRPKPEHVLQTVFYWHLAHRKGFTLTDTVSISYFTKSWQFGAKRAYKEYLINPQEELHRLEPMIEDALAYKAYRDGASEALPLRTFCSHPDSKDAKACSASTICFEV